MANYIIPDDSLNMAMLDGIYAAFKAELKEKLQAQADTVIEATVNELCDRLKLSIDSRDNLIWGRRDINLTWLLK